MKLTNLVDKAVLLVIVSVIFYVSIFFYADMEKVIGGIGNIQWNYYPLIFLIVGLYTIIEGLRYHIFLKKVGVKTNIKDSLVISLAGHGLMITPGGAGSLIKSYLIKKKFGNSIASTGPIILVERWLELLSIVALVLITFVWHSMIEAQIISILGVAVSILYLLTLRDAKIFSIISHIFSKIKYTKKFLTVIEESKTSLIPLLNLKTLSSTFGLTFLTKVLNLFVIFFIFNSVGVDIGVVLSGQIYYTSILLGALTLIPGGIIVADASMLGLILKNNIDFASATLVVVLSRFVTIWLGSLVGLVTLKISMFSKNHLT